MKKFTILLILLLSYQTYAQKKMVIHLKDGSQQTGYVTFKKKEIKFQEKLKDKKTKIAYETIDSLSSYVNPRAQRAREPKTVYVWATGKENKDYHVYDRVVKGNVNLYKYTSFGGYSAIVVPTGGAGAYGVSIPTGKNASVNYGVKRDGESFVVILGDLDSLIRDHFKSQGSKYFSDCPVLSEKIKNKEKGFSKKDIKKVVAFYNSQCSGH